ncbi:MAG: Phospholipid/cholesterol/gamma-HCH transport system substrate-binding protein [Marmoricola sp.]|nr:Phospholipid/cholesterol/gamma-HCH transport system substrate-binding protein [Marmoricola sp.]
MRRLTPTLTRIVVGIVVLAVVIGGAVYVLSGGNTKKVTADFDSAVGVYPGTPVDILGIVVGKVDSVKPNGNFVKITMEYDSKYKLPANAISVVVANSLVSDRYLQLAPAYSGSGPTLRDGATIPLKRTASPAELDQIYGALSKLSVALGPNGANKNGALSNFVKIADANLKGNGAALGTSITKLSEAAQTLSGSSGNLFATVKNLQVFTDALSQSDTQIRDVESELAQVSGDLASERADLGTALHNLSGALDQVATFVKTNAAKTHTDLSGLANVAKILVKEQSSLNETLAVGPAALANIVHAYQPDLGVLATRSNLASLTDPLNLCDVLDLGGLLKGNLLGDLTGALTSACKSIFSQNGQKGGKLPAGFSEADLKNLVSEILGSSGLGGLLPGS